MNYLRKSSQFFFAIIVKQVASNYCRTLVSLECDLLETCSFSIDLRASDAAGWCQGRNGYCDNLNADRKSSVIVEKENFSWTTSDYTAPNFLY